MNLSGKSRTSYIPENHSALVKNDKLRDMLTVQNDKAAFQYYAGGEETGTRMEKTLDLVPVSPNLVLFNIFGIENNWDAVRAASRKE